MFGKNKQRYLRIFSTVLAVVIIASMILAYFSLLI